MTYLEDIDIISLQPLTTILDSSKDPLHISLSSKSECSTYLSAKTCVVDESSRTVCFSISPFEKCLGHDDYAFPWDVVFLDEFTEDPLGVTL